VAHHHHSRRSTQSLAVAFLLTSAFGWAACGDDEGGGGGGGEGASSNSGKCYDVDVSTTDGGEACDPSNCAAGEYCNGNFCDNGCVGVATCPKGQFCDKSASQTNVGTCRVPGAEHEVACSGNGGSGTGATGTGASGTGGAAAGANCQARCVAKATLCDPDMQLNIDALCTGLCAESPTEAQLDCLESSSCEQLEGALVGGQPICDI